MNISIYAFDRETGLCLSVCCIFLEFTAIAMARGEIIVRLQEGKNVFHFQGKEAMNEIFVSDVGMNVFARFGWQMFGDAERPILKIYAFL